MSKVYCVECNLVFAEQNVKKYHDISNFKDHKYIKEENSMEAIDLLCKRINQLDEALKKQKEENEKVEDVLVHKIQENRTAMLMFRSENKFSKIKTSFELLNCKKCEYSANNKTSFCEMYRVKNIVYMKLEFNGRIEPNSLNGIAEISIKMPMWVIYSGSFNIESLNNCIHGGNEIKNLYANYKQEGNKLSIYIRKDGLNNVQTYWIKSKNSSTSSHSFVINGNFLIEPPSFLRFRKYYLYSLSEDKVVCEKDNKLSLTDDWSSGALIEKCVEKEKEYLKINGKFLNEANGFMSLEQTEKSLLDINLLPGYADIAFLYFIENNKAKYLLEAKNGEVSLRNDFIEKCMFVLIPKLEKVEKKK